ncbi:Nucleotidyltransferase domain-containing protein [Geosporobacter subterraneus DSM 17957]|uniref:Nucleotidyltransferase domain-containing protein n=2 Tax=Geosporobacter TaxID=390805 RepID=A0A1M6CMZ9_9FIRM|nr:Nucleotidyltransferase domain-containing protein [Geosporobacter subterraneus DSM 17957]
MMNNSENKPISKELNQYQTIPLIIDVIIKQVDPQKIILFGSCAKRYISKNSDIDLCVVIDEIQSPKHKRKMKISLLEKLLQITEHEVDILICSKEEWEKNHKDKSTFIGKIAGEGELIYGR